MDCQSFLLVNFVAISRQETTNLSVISTVEVIYLEVNRKKEEMAGNQMNGEELLKFMQTFKTTIETTMTDIGKDINKKIDEKLANLGNGLNELTEEVKKNENKQEERNKKLENRLNRLEIDAGRAKYARTKMNTKEMMDEKREELEQKDDRRKKEEKEKERMMEKNTQKKRYVLEKQNTERHEEEEEAPEIRRSSSWAEEVEREDENGRDNGTVREDIGQWVKEKRIPSNWAENLSGQVREAAEKSGKTTEPGKRRRMERERETASRMDKEHETAGRMVNVEMSHRCRSSTKPKINHWFGESSTEEEETSDLSEEENEEWSTIERQNRRIERKNRMTEKKRRKREEVAGKARRMAGIGPITDQDIETQRTKTNNYELAKVWAVKSHLASKYEYNQTELDQLEIVETKRTNKDDIIYIATENEKDIKDLYYRKAECKREDTTIKHFIPPQFWDRFIALNRICALRREEDNELKTQLRFGEDDLIILTKQKGSNQPFKKVNMNDFTGGTRIPEFDTKVKWKITEDRPPRRRINATNEPDNRQKEIRSPALQKQLVRQHSETTEDPNLNKKLRTNEKEVEGEDPSSRNTSMDTTT